MIEIKVPHKYFPSLSSLLSPSHATNIFHHFHLTSTTVWNVHNPNEEKGIRWDSARSKNRFEFKSQKISLHMGGESNLNPHNIKSKMKVKKKNLIKNIWSVQAIQVPPWTNYKYERGPEMNTLHYGCSQPPKYCFKNWACTVFQTSTIIYSTP